MLQAGASQGETHALGYDLAVNLEGTDMKKAMAFAYCIPVGGVVKLL